MVNWKFWQGRVKMPWDDQLKHVMRVSRKELRYFLRIHYIAEKMADLVDIAIANELATNDVNKKLSSNRDSDELRKRLAMRQGRDDDNIRSIKEQLSNLKKLEVREQLIAPVGKLETAINNLFDLIESKISASHQALKNKVIGVQKIINGESTNMRVFEGEILIETQGDLTSEVESGKWNDAKKTLREEILRGVAAFAQLDRELEKHLEGVDQSLQRAQQQAQGT